MPKLFDQILASRIKEVFNNHVEEYNPDDWQKMVGKLGKNPTKRTIVFLPFIAKAASIVVFVGLSVFSVNQNLTLQQEDQEIAILNTSLSQNQTQSIPDSIQRTENDAVTPISNDFSFSNQNQHTILIQKKLHTSYLNDSNLVTETYPDKTDSSKQMLADIKNVLKRHRENIQRNDSINRKNIMLADEDEFWLSETKNGKKQNSITFGIELASVSAYAPGAKTGNLNVGAGITADYKFSKNISFSSGVLIAKQSVDYNGSRDIPLSENIRSDYAGDQSLNLIEASSAESSINFVAIDIPMNLKFRHKHLVFTAGVSSLLFIDETYNYNYTAEVKQTTYNSATSKFETQNSTQNYSSEIKADAFSHFDFAKLINVALAYEVNLPKGSLAFEPYVKIPVAGISSRDVKVGTGGLTMRYNFR